MTKQPPPTDEDQRQMDRDRKLAEEVAQQVIGRLLDAIQSDEVAERVIGNWSSKMDRALGRALRRLGFIVLVGVLLLGAAKIDLLGKLAAMASKP